MASVYSHETIDRQYRASLGPDTQLSEFALFDRPALQREVESSYYEKIFAQEPGLDVSQDEIIFEVCTLHLIRGKINFMLVVFSGVFFSLSIRLNRKMI